MGGRDFHSFDWDRHLLPLISPPLPSPILSSREYALDTKGLKKRFLQYQARVHPDRYNQLSSVRWQCIVGG